MSSLGLEEIFVIVVMAILVFDREQITKILHYYKLLKSKMMNMQSEVQSHIHNLVYEPDTDRMKELRKLMKNRLAQLEEEDLNSYANAIINKLQKSDEYQRARKIAAFSPIQKEPNITPLLKSILSSGKTLYLPRIEKDQMHFFQISDLEKDLATGHFGIKEPLVNNSEPEEGFDLVLVPGLVFGNNGERIGRGKGYYDKFLGRARVRHTVGLGFETQIYHMEIPQGRHDRQMDKIYTELRIINNRKEKNDSNSSS